MLNANGSSVSKAAATLAACLVVLSGPMRAEDLSAGAVMERLKPDERYTYVAGIVEGLAYARFVADGKEERPGMACIYAWFYDEAETPEMIFAAFTTFPEHLPGAVVGALIQRRCGP